jgi:hypothetical protein
MLLRCSKIANLTNMLTKEQAKNIASLFDHFLTSELKGWTNLDNFLEILENNLDDSQIYRECEALYSIHKTQEMGSPIDHINATRFVSDILEAVEAIVELYRDSTELIPKHRYILCYYLALCQNKQIICLNP